MNGRIAGVTQSFQTGGSVTFSAYLPESAFEQGPNEVEILAISRWTARRRSSSLGGSSAGSYRLVDDGGTEAVEDADGRRLPTRAGRGRRPRSRTGSSSATRCASAGWAGDIEARVPADRVLVFAGDDLIGSGTPSVGRADLGQRYRGLGRSGFVFDLPRDRVGDGSDTTPLRFVAIHGDRASELGYARGFPWQEG